MYRHGPSCLPGPRSGKAQKRSTSAGTKLNNETNNTPREDDMFSPEAPIRKDLVERVRRAIAEGTYVTAAKWDAALDELFRRLEGD